jgi:hypothetical protein
MKNFVAAPKARLLVALATLSSLALVLGAGQKWY